MTDNETAPPVVKGDEDCPSTPHTHEDGSAGGDAGAFIKDIFAKAGIPLIDLGTFEAKSEEALKTMTSREMLEFANLNALLAQKVVGLMSQTHPGTPESLKQEILAINHRSQAELFIKLREHIEDYGTPDAPEPSA